jgi:hypothetical protein
LFSEKLVFLAGDNELFYLNLKEGYGEAFLYLFFLLKSGDWLFYLSFKSKKEAVEGTLRFRF